MFYPLARPFDVLEVERREAAGIRVSCDTPGIDLEHNTLTKAHAAFAALLPEQVACPGVDVTLRKGIPHGAGLGGGSSDAAALLLWLNSCLETPLPLEELEKAAIKVGADVPFFLHGQPRRVTRYRRGADARGSGSARLVAGAGLSARVGLHPLGLPRL